jgi:hypothetical protein
MSAASASQSGLSWEDTSSYLNALDTLLTTTPDTDALAAWRSAKQELQATFSASGAHAKRVLQELQASFARADAATAEAALPLEELRLRSEQVESRKAAVLERVQRMAVARDASAAAMQRLLQDTLSLREEQRRLEGMKQGASPQLQCVGRRRAGRHWGLGGDTHTPGAAPPLFASVPLLAARLTEPFPRTPSPSPAWPHPPPPPLLWAGTSWRSTLTSRVSSGTTPWRMPWRATFPPPLACRRACCALTRAASPQWPLQTGFGRRWPRPTGFPSRSGGVDFTFFFSNTVG